MNYIKLIILFFLFQIIFPVNLSAQISKKVKIDDNVTKTKILLSYIADCQMNGSFIHEKGVVKLVIYKNKEGKDCWLLIPLIDDSYKDNPPEKYAEVGVDLISIYYGDVNENALITDKKKHSKLNECLEEVIGDYLYIRPTLKRRTFEYLDEMTGNVRKTQKRIVENGNGGSLVIEFNKDGTYVTKKPV